MALSQFFDACVQQGVIATVPRWLDATRLTPAELATQAGLMDKARVEHDRPAVPSPTPH